MSLPYTQLEADLLKLAQQRTGEAIRSVLQLAENPGQAFQISLGGLVAAMATAAGAYAAYKEIDLSEVDNLELAATILTLMREAR